jgi:hypothetical protein
MRRIPFALLAASLVLSAPLVGRASGASVGPSTAERVTTAAAEKIVLRGRRGIQGPWRSYLWLKLVRGGKPTSFTLCAVWNQQLLTPACRTAGGRTLPEGATMLLEQRRSAGWKRVGFSTEAVLEAVLSNSESGSRLGTVYYRVKLQDASRRVLGTSNKLKVIWHK